MAPSSENDEKENSQKPSPSKSEVWLVNDDPAQLLVQKRLLGRFAEQVRAFGSPLEALHAARTEGPCPYLVSDMHMPGMTGLKLAQAWCELHDQARVLVASASRLTDSEQTEATDIVSDRIRVVASLRIPELLSAVEEWFGVDSGPLESKANSEPEGLHFFDSTLHGKLRTLGGDEFLRKALIRFADRMPDRVAIIRAALAKQDLQEVHREAHSMKGSCGVVGATSLFDIADHLELAAYEEQDAERLDQLIHQIGDCWENSKRELERVLGEL